MDTFALTHPQKRICYTERLFPNTSAANLVLEFRIQESVVPETLWRAIEMVIKANDGLRLRLVDVGDEIRQYVAPYQSRSMQYVRFDYSGGSADQSLWIRQQAQEPFPLFNHDLFRFFVVKYCDGEMGFLMANHHAISDAWTIKLISDQIQDLYSKLSSDDKTLSGALAPSYLDVIDDEIAYERSDRFKRDKQFWIDQLRHLPTPQTTQLNGETSRSIKSKRRTFVLTEDETHRIRRFSERFRISPYVLLFSLFNITIFRASSQQDFVVGTVTHNRLNNRERNTVGMFINTVPFRAQLEPGASSFSFMQKTTKDLRNIYRSQKYPYDVLVQDMRQQGIDLAKSINYVFSYENINFSLANRWHFSDHEYFPFVLHVTEREDASRLKCEVDFRENTYTQEEVNRWMTTYRKLLDSVLTDPSRQVSELELLPQTDRTRFIEVLNSTATKYPREKTIPQIFEQQAASHGERPALVFGDDSMSYRDLNAKANQLARVLLAHGMKSNACVGLIVDRTPEMMIAILAILKAGGSYVPINADYPDARIGHMLEDCEAQILLSARKYSNRVASFGGAVIALSDLEDLTEAKENLGRSTSAEGVATVVYTSGSTGKPKGNQVTHRNIVRVVKNTNYVDIHDDDVLLQLSNFAFDGSLFDIFGALLNGAKLVLVEKATMLDVGKLSTLVREKHISMFFVTTAMFNTIVDVDVGCLAKVRRLFFGGERVSFPHVEKALECLGQDKLTHVYGPTESTVFATYYPVNVLDKRLGTVPIGKPVANTEVYVLDPQLQPVPPGTTGELHIGGDGLVRGYLNLTEVTDAKFIDNPFKAGAKIYRTGDHVRLLEDGNIEFVGRKDHQVKRRGFRLELGEIEAAVACHPKVRDTIVVYCGNGANGILTAYYVAEEKVIDPSLERFLSERLPPYAIPDHFIELDRLPLNSNGKVDRRSLPLPNVEEVEDRGEESDLITETQAVLADIWRRVLDRSEVNLQSGFFELGGNSLTLMVMQSEIDKQFPGLVEIGDLFAFPTIDKLSRIIDERRPGGPRIGEWKTPATPQDTSAGNGRDDWGRNIRVELGPEVHRRLSRMCEELRTDIENVCLSEYVYLLSIISGQGEVTVYLLDEEGLTAPLTIKVDGSDDWLSLFKAVDTGRRGVRSNRALQISGQVPGKPGRSPLFAMCSLSEAHHAVGIGHPYDVVLKVIRKEGHVGVELTYRPERVKRDTVHELAEMYKRLTAVMLESMEENLN